MKFYTTGIVSNSDMIKNYKSCREKAESIGKIIIFKNNQPDAVLFSIAEYAKIAPFLEYMETHTEHDAETLFAIIPKLIAPEENLRVTANTEVQ